MLKKQHRLARRKDVREVFSSGRSFFSPMFTVKYLPASDANLKFTVVVSTKVSSKAVVRNKIKRVLREAIRLRLTGFRPGGYMVIVRPAACRVSHAVLPEAFMKFCQQIKIWSA